MTAHDTWSILKVSESDLELGPQTSQSEGWTIQRDEVGFTVCVGRIVTVGADFGGSASGHLLSQSSEELVTAIEKLVDAATISGETKIEVIRWINGNHWIGS